MNVGILFSGGKDSAYAAYLAKEHGHNISCFITLISQNPSSYMFHTPNIEQVEKQANAASIPLIVQHTKGEKEKELIDLKIAIEKAAEKYEIQGIITGAVESAYQASRVQKICNELGLDCFNPLWQKDQFELLDDLIRDKFDVIITGVFAYPLDKSWLGRKIDNNFLKDIKELNEKYMISPAGEGGEIETFVLNCPLFTKSLEIKNRIISGKNNSWAMEIDII